MNGPPLDLLRQRASAFRAAIERARAERAPGALPYFPEGACRMTSRLLAQHLAHFPVAGCGDVALVSGVLPGSERAARHYWLEVGDVVVDLTADAFGEPAVVVGSPTPFHRSLTGCAAEDASAALAALGPDESARLSRQLAAIEARLESGVAPGRPPASEQST